MTPTQVKILHVLSDGLPHKFEELQQVLPDNLGSRKVLNCHLVNIRATLRPKGEDIICQFLLRQRQYRHVRLLHSPNDGYR